MNRTFMAALGCTLLSGIAYGQYSYNFESLLPGDIVGQDGWGFFGTAPAAGSMTIQTTRISPMDGSTKALQMVRTADQAANPVGSVIKTLPSAFTSGHYRISYDEMLSARPFTGSNLTGRLALYDSDGTGGTDQLFQPYNQNGGGPGSAQNGFTDRDGLGDDIYGGKGLVGRIMFPDNWYRFTFDMDLDGHSIVNCRLFDIQGGTLGLPYAMGTTLNSRGDHSLKFYIQNVFGDWVQPLARYAFRYTGFADDPGNEYFCVDNFKIIPLVRVTGHVDFGDFVGATPETERIVIELRNPGDPTPIDQQAIAPDVDGNFEFFTEHIGTFDVSVKGSHWLRDVHSSVVITNSGANAGSFFNVNADIDGDNEVTLADYAALSSAFGSDGGEPGFTPPSDGWNRDADLNRDNEVSLADYATLANNFGQAGDE